MRSILESLKGFLASLSLKLTVDEKNPTGELIVEK